MLPLEVRGDGKLNILNEKQVVFFGSKIFHFWYKMGFSNHL